MLYDENGNLIADNTTDNNVTVVVTSNTTTIN